MAVRKISEYGNSFIGLYGATNDKVTLVSRGASEALVNACSAVLGTDVVKFGIGASGLIGIFAAMNSNGIVLPGLVSARELGELDKLGVKYAVIRGRLTALGNNVVANSNGALVNPRMSRQSIEKIGACLGVDVYQSAVAGHETVGAVCVATDKGFLVHNDASEEDVSFLEKVFGVQGNIGTINMGVPFVKLGMIANSKGYLIGEATSGFEAARVDEALGFLE
ncbi:MAG: translation initiation factor IF-6 [Candidatus Micrarchaeota archaeon]